MITGYPNCPVNQDWFLRCLPSNHLRTNYNTMVNNCRWMRMLTIFCLWRRKTIYLSENVCG